MMDRKLKQKLKQYTVPAYSEKALEKTIEKAYGTADGFSSHMSAVRMTAGQFFLISAASSVLIHGS